MKFSENDIEKFFSGKLSEKEAKEFLIWLHSKDGENVLNSRVDELWKIQTERDKEIKGDDQHIAHHVQMIKQKDINQSTKSLSTKFLRIAASLLIIFSITFIFFIKRDIGSIENQIVDTTPKEIIKSVPKGQKSKISLPDGSIVFLNSESSIKFTDNFEVNRTIHLYGEAFFEVAKDENHPFEVITDNLVTTALGTSFNIKAYENSSKIEVSLATGKVIIAESISNSQIEIKPGEGISYLPTKGELELQTVDIKSVLNWKDGILQFEKLPLPEVIEILERWYGVEIEIIGSNPSKTVKCTGTFKPNEYLSNVLDALGHSIEFNYKINQKKVTLDFK
ncbi:FecR family protein [Aquiflexum lacus]|uniref:FecR family protein n=1 Tax=Aquiflexum lacus TaxID=2483805 RepID=UPI0018945E6C|nr:FecR family protein [Aquiflexum lacus]